MFGKVIQKSLKKKISDGLIGKWLKTQELKEGEDKPVLMMFEENDKTMLLVCAVRITDKIEVTRVIESIDVEDAL